MVPFGSTINRPEGMYKRVTMEQPGMIVSLAVGIHLLDRFA